MGKPTGFLDYEREDAKASSPKERIKNFNEFHEHLSEEKQKCQAARCMDCGVPFCQNGKVISGMVWFLNGMIFYIMEIWNRHTTVFIRLTTFLNLLQEFVLHFVKKHVHVVFMEMQ